MAGPRLNPIPNAAPIIPIPRERSAGVVMSATYACAAEMLPPANPETTREMKSTQYDPAKANNV